MRITGENQVDYKTLLKRYLKIRKQTRDICHPLSLEDYQSQPITDVSPPKWHLAHTTWFFENFVLIPFSNKYQEFNPDFNFLFNSYYETVGPRLSRDKRGLLIRPHAEEIYDYRSYVNEHLVEFLQTTEDIPHQALNAIELGIQHEQQHQELLLTDIKYIFGSNPLFPKYFPSQEITEEMPGELPSENYIDMQEGIYTIGFEGDGFCFDNEKLLHKIFLHSFKFMDRLITNQEYLEFIEDGGYKDFRFWLQEGWDWVKQNKINTPLYWHKFDNDWFIFTLRGLKKLPLFDPVCHVSYYEADAFSRWRKKRLLTEFEWEAAAKTIFSQIPDNSNFLEKENYAPKHRINYSSQLFGDVWEWTSSAYLAYPGYNPPEGALGEYNGKFMINQMVLRGGSFATPQSHIRHTYRNFFHPDKQWQFSGIRLAELII
jgi:ergothioneine biosynthesis protein EgtB